MAWCSPTSAANPRASAGVPPSLLLRRAAVASAEAGCKAPPISYGSITASAAGAAMSRLFAIYQAIYAVREREGAAVSTQAGLKGPPYRGRQRRASKARTGQAVTHDPHPPSGRSGHHLTKYPNPKILGLRMLFGRRYVPAVFMYANDVVSRPRIVSPLSTLKTSKVGDIWNRPTVNRFEILMSSRLSRSSRLSPGVSIGSVTLFAVARNAGPVMAPGSAHAA